MKEIPHLLSLVNETVWAIRPEKLDEIIAVTRMKAAGSALPFEPPEKPAQKKTQGVAKLPLFGIIGQRMNMLMKFSGGTSTEIFTKELRGLLADPEVGGVIIPVDSPGGGVYGVPELAEEIFKARGKGKPIWAVADSMAASAAYWIGTAAEEMVLTPGGEVGSIGVYALHSDFSKANESEGLKVTYIKAGRFKTAGNPDEPLDKDARDYLQAGVDRYYSLFTNAVAKYRGKSVDEVRNGFGQGGMVGAKDAFKMGMVDRVATLDETVSRMLRTINNSASKPAAKSLSLSDERRRAAYADSSASNLAPEDEKAWRRFQLT